MTPVRPSPARAVQPRLPGGEWAIRCWVRHHWNGFLREKWLEHLEGRTFWIELDHDDFGLLQRAFRDSELIGEILDGVAVRWDGGGAVTR